MRLSIRPWPERLPPTAALVVAIAAAYLLFGLLDHDPWRGDDVVAIAIARSLAEGNWWLPRLAGEPWLGSPPLYHWIAAAAGTLLDGWLPWHAAARLASAAILGAGLYALSLAARLLHDEDAGRTAPLLAVGTLGLLVPAHEAQPALLGLLAVAAQLAALAAWERHPAPAAVALGLALAGGFLGSGISTLLPMAAILAIALLHPHWRRTNRRGWLLAFLVAVPLAAAWPLVLLDHSPLLAQRWWAEELRSLGGATALTGKRLEVLLWATWPVLPLALWMLWLERRRLTRPGNFIAVGSLAVTLMLFLRAAEPVQGLMPLLGVLALVAASAAGRLRRGAANAFDWFGSMTLTLFMALIWLGGIAILTGEPARVAKNFTKPAPGFIPDWSWTGFAVAVVITLAWLRLLVAAPRSPWRAASRWSMGAAATWILLVSLWMPWIDYGKSYRGVARELRAHIGTGHGCIERGGLDEGHRAALDYFAGIRTVPASASNRCDLRLVRVHPRTSKELAGWSLLREAARPGERSEVLRLYRRTG